MKNQRTVGRNTALSYAHEADGDMEAVVNPWRNGMKGSWNASSYAEEWAEGWHDGCVEAQAAAAADRSDDERIGSLIETLDRHIGAFAEHAPDGFCVLSPEDASEIRQTVEALLMSCRLDHEVRTWLSDLKEAHLTYWSTNEDEGPHICAGEIHAAWALHRGQASENEPEI